jgi:hypothetical protein
MCQPCAPLYFPGFFVCARNVVFSCHRETLLSKTLCVCLLAEKKYYASFKQCAGSRLSLSFRGLPDPKVRGTDPGSDPDTPIVNCQGKQK